MAKGIDKPATYDIIEEKYDKDTKQMYWDMAVGLNRVDGLRPSRYLIELSNKNINGEITNYKVNELLYKYYEKQDYSGNIIISEERECDLVSIRIVELLEDKEFIFSPTTLRAIHGYLFRDIYDFAGTFRTFNIIKKEPILHGESVKYASAYLIVANLEHNFKQESQFQYSGLSMKEKINRITEFTASIWQVHPFAEGNTRIIAVFIEKYLNTLGYTVNNDLFKENSEYFRNALVRANYANSSLEIKEENSYLVCFFDNLLRGKSHPLDSKNLVIKELQ